MIEILEKCRGLRVPHHYISYGLRSVYFRIGKNASQSIRKTLKEKDFERRTFCTELHKDFFKFAVIRNPLDRLVSSYLELNVRYGTKRDCWNAKFYFLKNDEDRFKTFVDEITDKFFDLHIAPQIYYLVDESFCVLDMDLYILFEKLEERFEVLRKKFNLEGVLRKGHASLKGEKERVFEIIDKNNLKDVIDEIYEEDWKLYNSLRMWNSMFIM